jgi:ferredoxin
MTTHLTVDPIACEGHGICAELLPEHITLDDWGYPIVDATAIPEGHLADARRAVRHCPALALRLRIARSPEDRAVVSRREPS